MLNFISSARVAGNFCPCLVAMGLSLQGMLKDGSGSGRCLEETRSAGRWSDKGGPSGVQEVDGPREHFSEDAGQARRGSLGRGSQVPPLS